MCVKILFPTPYTVQVRITFFSPGFLVITEVCIRESIKCVCILYRCVRMSMFVWMCVCVCVLFERAYVREHALPSAPKKFPFYFQGTETLETVCHGPVSKYRLSKKMQGTGTRPRMEKLYCGRTCVWQNVNIMFHKNKMGSIIRTGGTIFSSLLYSNSRLIYNGLKHSYSAISVIDNSLPGTTKK